jgi:UDP-N-acetylglucosamine 2-epimerase (non-hydrolysing)
MTVRQKILFIFGTRPEVIKLAPVILEMKKYPEFFEVVLCSSGQHKELLELALGDFGLNPDYYLQVMDPDQSLSSLTSKLLDGLSKVMEQCLPDLLLIQGDTTTVMAGALAAFYKGIQIGHIEAGLRSHNLHSPFPEEFNRRVVSLLANYHFTPTNDATLNLTNESTDSNTVFETGNTIVDSLIHVQKYKKSSQFTHDIEAALSSFEKIILVTAHRRENFGESIIAICNSLKAIVHENREVGIIFPVHMNPNVMEPVHRILGEIPQILLVQPLSYPNIISLMQKCYLVLTDSGGIQEEALALSIPVLVMRDTTEREEGVRAGGSILVGTDSQSIVSKANKILKDEKLHRMMSDAANPYGDGTAAAQIVSILIGKM